MVVAVAVLLALTVTGAIVARFLVWPQAIVLLAIGGLFGALRLASPAVPALPYDSDVVFALLFPALLFAAAYDMPWNDLRVNLGRNVYLSLSTVIVATLLVGGVVKLGLGVPWVAALLAGVCLADPDFGWFLTRADEKNTSRPLRRALTSEGLIEGTAMLVLFTVLVSATAEGRIDWLQAAARLVLGSAVGVLVGAAVAWAALPLFRKVSDPRTLVVLSIALPFLAYLPAQALGGVRLAAVVSAGLVAGHLLDPAMPASARLWGRSSWNVALVVLPGVIYLPAGAALVGILAKATIDWQRAAAWGLALAVVSVAARFAWVGLAVGLARLAKKDWGPWRDFATGLLSAQRGAFALASALALPAAGALRVSGNDRDLIVAIVLATVLISQVLQPPLIGWAMRRWAQQGDGREDRERSRVFEVLDPMPMASDVDSERRRRVLRELRDANVISGEIFQRGQEAIDTYEAHLAARKLPPSR